MNRELILTADCVKPERIDKWISQNQPELSRSYVQRLLKEGRVLTEKGAAKANDKISEGEQIHIFLPEPETLTIKPENIPLDILYEDADIIIINKEKGMVVHPSQGHSRGTVVNALLYHCKDQLSGINGVLRPGIVHRIDMDTTGAIVACKNDKAHQCVAEQLKEHSITRLYEAITYHYFREPEGVIDAPIGRHPVDRKRMAVNYRNGKRAVTHYRVLENLKRDFSYIECRLETGRTHQIRVHMASVSHPLLGDMVYGPQRHPFSSQGQLLHARVLGLIHPSTREYMEFQAPLPAYFQDILEKLR